MLSPLVPGDLRPHFRAVYDYCRLIDDLADDPGVSAMTDPGEPDSETRLKLLALARSELHAAAQGLATNPVFVKLGDTIRAKSLPLEPFDDLIRAFEQDQRVHRYDSWDQVLDYCTRSANPVGRIILMLDAADPDRVDAEHLRLSDQVCTALQLINFWQDVRRDLIERDRIYLPAQEFPTDGPLDATLRDWMSRPDDPEARLAYMRRLRPLVRRTAEMFAESAALHRQLGPRLGPVVWLFWKGGIETLRRVEREGCTTLWKRPRLTGMEKGAFVLQAIVGKWLGRWRGGA